MSHPGTQPDHDTQPPPQRPHSHSSPTQTVISSHPHTSDHAGPKTGRSSHSHFSEVARDSHRAPEAGLGSPACRKASPISRHSLGEQTPSPSIYRPELVTRMDSLAERGNGCPRSERGCQAGLQAWAGAPHPGPLGPPPTSPLASPIGSRERRNLLSHREGLMEGRGREEERHGESGRERRGKWGQRQEQEGNFW